MTRRAAIVGVLVVALAATAVWLYLRAAPPADSGVIAVAGDVRADEFVVRAPSITQPTVDYTVGITAAGAPTARKRPAQATPATVARGPVVAGFLSEVLVTEGARVATGQVLARIDTSLLDLGVNSAELAAARGRADLDVLDNNVDKLHDAQAKLRTGRRQLTAARASLSATITVLVARRASLETSIAQIRSLIALPGGPPPHVPPYPVILASLRGALAGLNAGIAAARTGLATIGRNLAKIAQGLAQSESALQKLEDARDLLEIDVKARDVAVRIAASRREQAAITSPASGLVTFARLPGTAVMVGAPIVRVRAAGPVRIDTFLTAAQLAEVHLGTPVTVDFDSNPAGPVPGRIAVIGTGAVVPPTAFPTTIVHMTRAIPVTIELDADGTAPAGTPVDIRIATAPAGR